jgi:hypothetical protein
MAESWPRRPRCLSACGYARRGPAYSEGQNALQQARVSETGMPGRRRELLALCDFWIGVGLDKIRSS